MNTPDVREGPPEANMVIPVTAPDGTKGEIYVRVKGGRTVEEWVRDVVAPELGHMIQNGLTQMHRSETETPTTTAENQEG